MQLESTSCCCSKQYTLHETYYTTAQFLVLPSHRKQVKYFRIEYELIFSQIFHEWCTAFDYHLFLIMSPSVRFLYCELSLNFLTVWYSPCTCLTFALFKHFLSLPRPSNTHSHSCTINTEAGTKNLPIQNVLMFTDA